MEGDRYMEACYKANIAKNIEEFTSALKEFDGISVSFVIATVNK